MNDNALQLVNYKGNIGFSIVTEVNSPPLIVLQSLHVIFKRIDLIGQLNVEQISNQK